jgi:hypothetical protein
MAKLGISIVAVFGCLASTAFGSQTATLSVGLEPNQPGASTTLTFDFAIAPSASFTPSPLVSVDLHLPSDIAYDTSSLGLASCDSQTLAQRGVSGCPADSRIGFGSATVVVPLGPTLLTEKVGITTLVGRSENGHIEVLYYATGQKPVIAQFMFSGELASERSGERMDTTIPLITTLPEASNAAVIMLQSTLGPKHLYYYAGTRGKRVRYHPRGIVLPAACPDGGFPFSASFGFEDGSTASASSTVPCPLRTSAHRF